MRMPGFSQERKRIDKRIPVGNQKRPCLSAVSWFNDGGGSKELDQPRADVPVAFPLAA
jgi:hypothetical protein